MFYNVLKVKDLANLDGDKFKKDILMKSETGCFDIIGLKKDEIIDTHTSDSNAAVYIIDGEIDIHFDAQSFNVQKHELLMFKKDEQHKVVAKKDSKFFLIKI